MPIYVSLLRGINVGGHKKIKMDQLRASLEAMGLKQVQTYIQSGNVVFQTTAKASLPAVSRKIEARILSDFGHSVSVMSRTADEISRTVAGNPFLKERGLDPDKFHVMFLSESPEPAALKQLASLTAAPDQFRSAGKELYFYLPNGVAGSVVMKNPVDRILAVVTTTRNWRTVNTIHQMCLDCR